MCITVLHSQYGDKATKKINSVFTSRWTFQEGSLVGRCFFFFFLNIYNSFILVAK